MIEDREKFSELVRHQKNFIDDLEDLTKATQIPRRQLVFVEYEVESINDIETLEDMESAREGDHDSVSDAASARIERLSQGTLSRRSSIISRRTSFMTMESVITLESLESYFTARTHLSSYSSTDFEEFLSSAGFRRIAARDVFKSYNDQAASNRLLRLQARPRNSSELLRKGVLKAEVEENPRLK
jgi:hypothetical protein